MFQALRMFQILKNKRGFTLIELVIIIILLGILAAIAIPRYVDLRNHAIEASAQATLDSGRAGVSLDFANQVLTNGSYADTITNGEVANTEMDPANVIDLENTLQSSPNYPPNGPYNNPAGTGYRWWVVTVGVTTGAIAPGVIDAIVDATCTAGNSQTGVANADCWVSKL